MRSGRPYRHIGIHATSVRSPTAVVPATAGAADDPDGESELEGKRSRRGVRRRAFWGRRWPVGGAMIICVDRMLERLAAEIVRTVLGGADVEERDGVPDALPGVHDFDVLFANGSHLAVEVTTATDPSLRELWAAVAEHHWTFSDLRWSWGLVIRPDTRVGVLHRAVGLLLAELEGRGVDRYNAAEPHDKPGRELTDLGVRYAKAVPGPGEPVVLVGTVGPADWFDGSNVCEAVEREAAKADNCRKLLAAGAGELFVWVDPHASSAHAALSGDVSLPQRPPRLPAGITGVWAARSIVRPDGRAGAAVVLRGDPRTGWTNFTSRAMEL